MSAPAAIRAVFADWRTVKTRKSLQLIFEIPLEQQSEVLAILGAPMPDAEIWCGIARLVQPQTTVAPTPAAPDRSQAAKDRYAVASPGEQAVMRSARLAQDRQFQSWAAMRGYGVGEPTSESIAIDFIRESCGIDSRREIASDERAYQAFLALELEYKQATGQFAEIR